MDVITYSAFKDEMYKIAKKEKSSSGALPPALSMGGLAGLTGLEAAGAFNKKKTRKERVLAGAGAASTGAILASEAIHNKDLLKRGLNAGMNVFRKIPKHASAETSLADGALSLFKKADADLWNPSTGHVIGEGGSRAFNRGVSTAASTAAKKPAFTMAHLMAAKAKLPGGGAYQGLKRGIGAVASHAR